MRKDQSLRFCHCIDSLALYANKKLNMYDDMFEKNSKFLNQEFRHDVLNEIFWYERDIIDEYVKVNEEGMLESTLQEIRNWKHAIADYFLVAKVTEDYAILSNTDFSFKVVGITQKINEVCPNAPTWVNTTLLTFEGEITFAMSMSEFNIDYGIEAKKMLKEESKKILDGKIIEYADDFIQLSPKANKKIKDRKKKKANKKNPFDESQPGKMKTSYVKPSKGTHESPLKGLSGEERNNEMDKNLNVDTKNAIHKILDAQYLDIAKNYAVAHKPITKYADFVKTCKDVDKSWQQNSVSELIDKLEHIFGLKDELAYSLIEMLEDNDWVYTIDLESDDYWLLDVDLLIPYGNLFYYNEKFTWVVFEEFRDAIKSANWEAINVMHEINSAVIDTCNKLVEMCGVLEASDVFKQYTNWYPDFDFWKDADNFASRLEFLAEVCEKECMFVISNPTDDKLSQVLINKRLIEDYDLYDDDIDEDDEEFNQRLEDFDEELLRIVQHQCRFKFSVFPKELRDQAAIEYYLSIPEIQEFRDFFDERVPDDMDAYQYSEVLTEHLIFSQRNGEVGASNIGDFNDGNGLDFSEDELAEFLNRYTNAANTLPRWENYGHSPAELFNDPSLKNSEEEYQKNLRKWGMGIASSEAHKNIGRNEPCPCGSGKKYKKCCGKLV